MMMLFKSMKIEWITIITVFGLTAIGSLGIPPYLATVQLYKNGFSGSAIGAPVGVINFVQNTPGGPVHVTGLITEMPPGDSNLFGFHVHERGLISDGCKAALGHYNPMNKTHGGPNDATRHVGDLGNIVRLSNNSAYVDITDSVIQLVGPFSIVGRALVLHDGTDDLGKGNTSASVTTGNAGNRFACGVIGIASDFSPSKSSIVSINVIKVVLAPLTIVYLAFMLPLGI